MTPLTILPTREEEHARMTAQVRARCPADRPLEVLEAGCGRRWPIDMQGLNYHLVGLDADEAALRARREIVGDLHETLLGDLRSAAFPAGRFDIIYNSFVLEHVQGAQAVLDNFLTWLRPGGVMILRLPDRDTVFGFTTRLTPFWFHVLYKKYVEGNRNAGKPGHDPYPTFYDHVVSRRGIHGFAARHGLRVVEEFGLNSYLDGPGAIKRLMRAYVWTMGRLSLGALDWRYNDLYIVLQKPEPGSKA